MGTYDSANTYLGLYNTNSTKVASSPTFFVYDGGTKRMRIEPGFGKTARAARLTECFKADQRVIANGGGGKTGSANTFLNYAGDASTVTASITADGSASFGPVIYSVEPMQLWIILVSS